MPIPEKSWFEKLHPLAAPVYSLLILLQIPLFRIPCRAGMCTTPVHVIAGQLSAIDIFPKSVIKGLLYPGAIAHGLAMNMSIPAWDSLNNIYNLTNVKEVPARVDFAHISVVCGCYPCIVGAILKPGTVTTFGTFSVVWGVFRDLFPIESNVRFYPTLCLAMLCAYPDMVQRFIARNTPKRKRPSKSKRKRSSKSKRE